MKGIYGFCLFVALSPALTAQAPKLEDQFGNPKITESDLRFGDDTLFLPVEFYHPSYDCKFHEEQTDWKADSVISDCPGHEWAYAEHWDVNEVDWVMLDTAYFLCGRGGQTNYARICRKCGQHERRTYKYWYEQVPRPVSEYQILKKKYGGDN